VSDFSATTQALDRFGAFLSRLPARRGQGPLAHLRFCVKDNIEVEGQPFTAGQPVFSERHATRTAPAVQRLLDLGAAFVGMTRTDSGGFGMTTPEVENPLLPGRIVGGSSGGAAAAVAAGLADIGLGTDTGGSIRVPAACTGLFGFKPSRGAVSMEGVWPLAPTFDHVGLIARDLLSLSQAARALLPDQTDMNAGFRCLRIAVEDVAPNYIGAEVRAAFEAVLATLAESGHEISRHSLPDRYDFANAFGTIVVAEATQIYAGIPNQMLGPAAARALANGPPTNEQECRQRLDGWVRAYEACLASCDVLLSPTLFVPPPQRNVHAIEAAGTRWPLLMLMLSATCFCNAAGVPALAMPVGHGTLPFSLHLACGRGRDAELLSLAHGILDTLENRTT
jgi:Asp-tRNA(Asn)/Glu-tRNA(Gln) amidotransferase A subunit family amidase